MTELHEMDFNGFEALVEEDPGLGYDEATAADYAARVGDCREEDDAGLTVVRNDTGEVIARLALKD